MLIGNNFITYGNTFVIYMLTWSALQFLCCLSLLWLMIYKHWYRIQSTLELKTNWLIFDVARIWWRIFSENDIKHKLFTI